MAARRVAPGCPLGPTQFEVMRLVADGWSYPEIATLTGRNVSTIRGHIKRACDTLAVTGRSVRARRAVAIFIRHGWHNWQPEPEIDHDGARSTFERALLDTFDEHLANRDARSRERMRLSLIGICHERQVPADRVARGELDCDAPLERIIRAVFHYDRHPNLPPR
jgi:DNA-binding CsgD family transcriptional regulator